MSIRPCIFLPSLFEIFLDYDDVCQNQPLSHIKITYTDIPIFQSILNSSVCQYAFTNSAEVNDPK